jgi:O-antigen/teichoic acid export membrane protein
VARMSSPSNPNLKTKMLVGTAWTSLCTILDKVISLITIAFLVRLLEPKDFCTVAVCTIVMGVASNFSDIGFEAATIQRQRDVSRAASSPFYMTIVLCTLNYFLLFSLSKKMVSSRETPHDTITESKTLCLRSYVG